jgi:hypothetical protein
MTAEQPDEAARPAPPAPPAPRHALTIRELEDWEHHGATWRAVELSSARAVVELCTCYGEPVDLVQGEAPELIEYVRSRRGG